MFLAALPILQIIFTALGAGTPIAAAVSGISIAQWVTLGSGILSAAPGEIEALQVLHPIFANIINAVIKTGEAAVASTVAKDWLTANGDAAIKFQQSRDMA